MFRQLRVKDEGFYLRRVRYSHKVLVWFCYCLKYSLCFLWFWGRPRSNTNIIMWVTGCHTWAATRQYVNKWTFWIIISSEVIIHYSFCERYYKPTKIPRHPVFMQPLSHFKHYVWRLVHFPNVAADLSPCVCWSLRNMHEQVSENQYAYPSLTREK
jgi:hypothetical protein